MCICPIWWPFWITIIVLYVFVKLKIKWAVKLNNWCKTKMKEISCDKEKE